MNDDTMNDDSILVTGATGGIGRELVRLLHDAGAPVVAMCRRDEQIASFRRDGVEAVHGDFDDPGSLPAAMEGRRRVFLLTFPGQDQLRHGRAGVEAAVRAGVEHVVHLGAADADPASPVPWAAAPARTDLQLQRSGLQWTLIRPSAFMQNLVSLAGPMKRGILPQATGWGKVGWIDTDDIARVAAHVLTTDGHHGQDYVLTGPERLSMPQIADEFSHALHHRIRYLNIPGPIFQAVLRLGGADAWTARGLRQQFAEVVRKGLHDVDDLTDTVTDLTGIPPRHLADFIGAHQDEFS